MRNPTLICGGLTLVELVTTLAVVTIGMTIAVPGILKLSSGSALTTETNLLIGNLHLARSEAIKRGLDVYLCTTDNGNSCVSTIEWSQGYMVFVDTDSDGSRDRDEPLLSLETPESDRVRIRSSTSKYGRKKIRYQPTGMARGFTATFTLCDKHGSVAPRAVIISGTGRPRSSATRADGSAIDCS